LLRRLSALVHCGAHLVERESAWERVSMPVPARVFGPGSRLPFTEYFEGESRVHVRSIGDIVS
jgi:hypothetical protein